MGGEAGVARRRPRRVRLADQADDGAHRGDVPARGRREAAIAGAASIDGEALRNRIAFDNVRKAVLGADIAPLATTFLSHGTALTAFCVATLAVELGAPIALLGGRIARGWALAAWGFHLAVVLTMNIWLIYPLVGFAFLSVLDVERPMARAIRAIRRGGTRSADSGGGS